MTKHPIKPLCYEQVARIGKAMSSPKRLELLDVLAQSEKSVEALANELSIEIKLASAHLKVLKASRLVDFRKDGKFVFYRLANLDVANLWVAMREAATEHLVELRMALNDMASTPDKLASVSRHELMDQARKGELVVIDVRPVAEYDVAHLPLARSMPLAEIGKRIAELPKDKEIVAYCRGPFCLFAEEAAKLLSSKGFKASKLLDGVAEWRAAGMALESKRSP